MTRARTRAPPRLCQCQLRRHRDAGQSRRFKPAFNSAADEKINAAKPGVIIGKGGAEIEKVRAQVKKLIGKDVILDILEIKRSDKEAQLVAENIAQQLENRVSFRRAMKSLAVNCSRLSPSQLTKR